MKTFFKTIMIIAASLVLISNNAEASVTILTTSVRGALDAISIAVSSGTLGLVVVDTGNNGFGQLSPSSIASGAFVGDGDDWIAGRVISQESFGQVFFQLSSIPSFNIADSVPTSGPSSQGDEFAFIWLPGLGAAANNVVAGQSYGQVRPTDAEAISGGQEAWRIPADGNDVNGFDITSAGPATLVVSGSPIPEPSVSILLLLGMIGLLRRRNGLSPDRP